MPELDPKALHGLVGEVARRMEPQMEVSAGAVAVDLLCCLAHAVGPNPRTLVSGEPEPANFNVLKVGLTGVAKSYTAKPAGRVMENEIGWRDRILYDIYTPQGLLAHISDTYREEDEILVRPEIEKQRLLRLDEFGTVLNRAKNPETTILQYMNYGFDGSPMDIGSLAARERGGRSTGHYISCITNVTPEALLEQSKLAANGFLNRFLLFWVAKGDRDIPSPERVDLSDFAREATRVVNHWREQEGVLLSRTPEAEKRWVTAYSDLNRIYPGVYGQMLVRGRVYVPRLSLAYAIADRADAIDVDHLEAALALWAYHCQTVEQVFGRSLGDRHADRIYEYLAEVGESEKEPLRRLVGGSTATCNRALAVLEQFGLVKRVEGKTTKRGGRPPELWRAAA